MNGKVGFIGVGTMGAPMARRLLGGGFAVVAFDRDPAALDALAADGAKAATCPAEAARGVEILITMLPNGEDVEEALFGERGAAEALPSGALFVDMSTIAPAATDRLATRLRERGVAMLDAPVGRTSAHAAEGRLLIMVGGEASALERARPLLALMGDTIVHCGPGGSGARMKVVNNYMSIVLNVLSAETLTLAEAAGLDPELARGVLLGTAAGQGHLGTTWPAKVLRGDLSPGFMVDLAHKDLGLGLALAADLDAPAGLGAVAREVYRTARRRGLGRRDWSAIYPLLRREAGLDPADG